ncbi:unnamed protein product [Candida verbasci]|uniref:Uncharacterized protein n=1 Tax=Candida verbasci TaxID=1227364 RepID=A0A9W4XFJ6_9ASCO|nr:unnamed protein product [Candida verbasci]
MNYPILPMVSTSENSKQPSNLQDPLFTDEAIFQRELEEKAHEEAQSSKTEPPDNSKHHERSQFEGYTNKEKQENEMNRPRSEPLKHELENATSKIKGSLRSFHMFEGFNQKQQQQRDDEMEDYVNLLG